MSDKFENGAEDAAEKPGKRSTGKAVPLDQIVASLKDMQRSNFTKETEWLFEKS